MVWVLVLSHSQSHGYIWQILADQNIFVVHLIFYSQVNKYFGQGLSMWPVCYYHMVHLLINILGSKPNLNWKTSDLPQKHLIWQNLLNITMTLTQTHVHNTEYRVESAWWMHIYNNVYSQIPTTENLHHCNMHYFASLWWILKETSLECYF